MTNLTAAQRRYRENAVLFAATGLVFRQLEVDGAPIATISEIAETESGGTPSRTVSTYFGGNIPWLKSGDLTDGPIKTAEESITSAGLEHSAAKVFSAGTVVIALYGATVGKTGILTFDAASNQAVCAVRPKNGQVSGEYLFWFLRHKRQDFLNASFGGAQPNISQRILRETRLPVPERELQLQICKFFHTVVERRGRSLREELPPLPKSLCQQRRIVAKIERLAAKIDEARELSLRSGRECDQLCRSLISDGPKTVATPMHDLVSWRKPNVEVVPTGSYEFAGVYCFGRGVFRGGRKSGLEFAYKQLSRIRAGEFIYPKLMAWEGALGIVPHECDGLYVSPEFPVFEINEARVLPEVLDVYFRSPNIWPSLSGASTGTNVRRKRLNPTDFLNYQFPLPPMTSQLVLRNIRTKVDELKRLQSLAAAELDALLPAILDRAFKGQL